MTTAKGAKTSLSGQEERRSRSEGVQVTEDDVKNYSCAMRMTVKVSVTT